MTQPTNDHLPSPAEYPGRSLTVADPFYSSGGERLVLVEYHVTDDELEEDER